MVYCQPEVTLRTGSGKGGLHLESRVKFPYINDSRQRSVIRNILQKIQFKTC